MVITKMKNKTDWSSINRILRYIWKRHKVQMIISFGLILVSSLVTVYVTSSIQELVDDYIMPLTVSTEKDFTPLIHFLIQLGMIGLCGVVANYAFSLLLGIIAQDTLRSLRDELFSNMQRLPVMYFDTHAHGDIMSVYTNDIDTLRQAIEQSIPQFLASTITIIGVTVAMISVSPTLFGVVFMMLIIMSITVKHISSQSKVFFQKQQKNLGIENGFIEEMMAGQKVIKAFVYEDEAIAAFDKINEELFDSSYKANAYASILFPTLGNLGNISYVLIAVIGGAFTIFGIAGLTIGGLVSFLQLNRSFTQPIAQVSQQLNFVLMALAGADRIFELLGQETEVNDGKVTLVHYEMVDGKMVETNKSTNLLAWKHPHQREPEILVPLVGDVVFKDVNFSYNDKNQILYDINLSAKQGQKIAFVGATGAGKTTITNLINRFYDIQSGMITYDGIDVKLIDKNSLRKSLGIVLQDTHLFTGTIAENIAYGCENASREEILQAAAISNVDSFVKHLDDGYDTILTSDGAGLSNGQRQLIAIARAALANAPVLILDEATSSIDSRTERMVQKSMDNLMEGRTVFVIAHRLSTIVNSDMIMVMDQGRIIERGSHDELMKLHGTYYRLYTGGFGID